MAEAHPTSKLACDLLDLIIANYRQPGEATSIVNTAEATHALSVALAMLVEADGANRTLSSIREASQAIGKQVHAQAKLFREEYQQTGSRAWLISHEAIH